MYGRISDQGLAPYPLRGALAFYTNTSQSAIGWWGWGYHTARGGVDSWELHFFSDPWVGVVEIWEYL